MWSLNRFLAFQPPAGGIFTQPRKKTKTGSSDLVTCNNFGQIKSICSPFPIPLLLQTFAHQPNFALFKVSHPRDQSSSPDNTHPHPHTHLNYTTLKNGTRQQPRPHRAFHLSACQFGSRLDLVGDCHGHSRLPCFRGLER